MLFGYVHLKDRHGQLPHGGQGLDSRKVTVVCPVKHSGSALLPVSASSIESMLDATNTHGIMHMVLRWESLPT